MPDWSFQEEPPLLPQIGAPRSSLCLPLQTGASRTMTPTSDWAVGGLVVLLSPSVCPPPAPERISYVPQLSSPTLAGTLTQSTFTLEQPRGQFSRLNISDLDTIWLVVAHSNGGCCRGRPGCSLCEMGRPGRSSGCGGRGGWSAGDEA